MASNPADRIEELLKAKGWSKRRLASEAGMNPSQGANIITRLRAKPDAIEKATPSTTPRSTRFSRRVSSSTQKC